MAGTGLAATVLAKRLKGRKLPTVDVPNLSEPELNRALEGIKEHLRMYEGDSGAPKERFVTIAELENAGVITSQVKNRFAFIAEVQGVPVSQPAAASSTSITNIINNTTTGGGGVDTLAALLDTSVAGSAADEFLQYSSGRWNNFDLFGTVNVWTAQQNHQADLLFDNATAAINWKTFLGGSVELLNFTEGDGSATPATGTDLPDVNTLVFDSTTTAGDLSDGEAYPETLQGSMSADGTTIFAPRILPNRINQYSLSVPYDLTSTVTFVASSADFLPASSAKYPQSMRWTHGGTVVWVPQYATGTIVKQTITTPYDVTEILDTWDQSYNVGLGPDVLSIHISDDGLHLAASDDGGRWVCHVMSTAYDLTTASAVGVDVNIPGMAGDSGGLVFSLDGTRAWVLERLGTKIHQFSFATPWEVSTSSQDVGIDFTINGGAISVSGMDMDAARGELYVGYYGVAGVSDNIIEKYTFAPFHNGLAGGLGGEEFEVGDPSYALELDGTLVGLKNAIGINWDDVAGDNYEFLIFGEDPEVVQTWPQIDTFTQQDTAEWVQQESNNCRFNDDGTRMYRGCENNTTQGGVYYGSTYGTAYVVTDSNTPVQILTTNEEINDIAFNGDGTKVFIAFDDGTGKVEERTNIGTPFNPEAGDIDTVADTYNSASLTGALSSVEFSADGTVVYLTGRSASIGCAQAVLSTPWDLSTAATETTIDFTDMGVNPSHCLRMAPDGLKFYVMSTVAIYEYNCTVAFDVTGSAVYQSRSLTVTTEIPGTGRGFDVSPDGTTIVVGGHWGNTAANNDTNRFTSPGTGVGSPATTGFIVGDPAYPTIINGPTTVTDLATFTAGVAEDLTIIGGAPKLFMQDDDASAEEGMWIIANTTNQFRIETAADAAPETPIDQALTIERTGTTVDSVAMPRILAGSLVLSTDVGLTADVSSVQGGGVIVSTYNVYSTVATAGDAATLPATFAVGEVVQIKNDGAFSMDVFPASGDDAGPGVDTAAAVSAGTSASFVATIADSTWSPLSGELATAPGVPDGTTQGNVLLWDQTTDQAWEIAPNIIFNDDGVGATLVQVTGSGGNNSPGEACFNITGTSQADLWMIAATDVDTQTAGLNWEKSNSAANEFLGLYWSGYGGGAGFPGYLIAGKPGKLFLDGDNVQIRGGSLLMREKAGRDVGVFDMGQVWVKTGTPATLYYSDDAGTDWLIGGTGAGVPTYALTGFEIRSAANTDTELRLIEFTHSDSTVRGQAGFTSADGHLRILNAVSNQDIYITPTGTGNIHLGTMEFDADQSIGASEDNYVLTYDHASTSISLETRGVIESESVTATNVITAAESGKTFYLNTATGFTSTLPAPAIGLNYKFIVATAPTTSGGYIVTTDAGANILEGTFLDIVGELQAIAAQDTLTFVFDVSLVGDRLEVESDGTNWYCKAFSKVDGGITVSVT